MSDKTIVVNFFAGPCAGKSTLACAVVAELKFRGINAELVTEVAKDHVWDHSSKLEHQLVVYGEQKHRVDRLIGKVDVIVTDSPALLSVVYDSNHDAFFRNMALHDFIQESEKCTSINYFVERSLQLEFRTTGRVHNEKAAKRIDIQIEHILDEYAKYERVQCTRESVEEIADHIEYMVLGKNNRISSYASIGGMS